MWLTSASIAACVSLIALSSCAVFPKTVTAVENLPDGWLVSTWALIEAIVVDLVGIFF